MLELCRVPVHCDCDNVLYVVCTETVQIRLGSYYLGHNSAVGMLPPSISMNEDFGRGRQRRPVPRPAVQRSSGGGTAGLMRAGPAS